MNEVIHEINKQIKAEIISAISFQNTIVWNESYLQNGNVIAPNVPVMGNKIIKSLKFSVLGEEKLRNEILKSVLEKNEDEKVKFVFKVHPEKKICHFGVLHWTN